jgi:microcystin-dependent protein
MGLCGRIKPFSSAPPSLSGEIEISPGFLLCNGAAVSRARYASLFARVGTAYGVGDGSTTFNLPDLQGRAPHGQATAGTYATRGASGGAETVTLAIATMPAVSHTYNGAQSVYTRTNNGQVGTNQGFTGTTSSSTGGGGAHNNLPPYQVANYGIAY